MKTTLQISCKAGISSDLPRHFKGRDPADGDGWSSHCLVLLLSDLIFSFNLHLNWSSITRDTPCDTNMSSVVFGNPADRVNWKPSNESRGTWDILSTCLLTMILCVWTAVHLNVPPPGAAGFLILRKLGWLFMGLLAPELVAASAWYV